MRKLSWLCVFIALCSCKKSDVRNACEQFMKGRIAFNEGDATLLKEVTSDSLFLVIELNKAYMKSLRAGGTTAMSEDIKGIRIGEVKITEDCAICNTNLEEYYYINVCKDGDVWKVQGENDKYPTAAQILRTKEKIKKQKAFLIKKPAIDSVLKVVNAFHKAVKTYFLTQDLNTLAETCDAATLKAIKAMYAYTKKIKQLEALREEINFPKALTMDPIFDGKKVKCKFYKEAIYINLTKIDNNYIMTGLMNTSSDQLTKNNIKTQYLDLLRSLKLLRTKRYWKNMKFMQDAP